MANEDASRPCFLTEWYQPASDVDGMVAALDTVCAQMRANGRAVRLLGAIEAAADEVLYGLFVADSATAVALACRLAGWPADRVIEGVQARLLPQ
ncbi:hypothetical protein [Mycolicibacterium obuense]|uniref:hypothetical protein n=1 Tax=Mycolicibacterium obuense TaxID=1807 RepID=UPI000699C02C|nr:hypothetical protein [Mycolicibacterium obuense]